MGLLIYDTLKDKLKLTNKPIFYPFQNEKNVESIFNMLDIDISAVVSWVSFDSFGIFFNCKEPKKLYLKQTKKITYVYWKVPVLCDKLKARFYKNIKLISPK